jgi:phage/plasmid-like protein (TIGR03299 family)
MAHELTHTNGKVEFAYSIREGVPWHALGTPLQGYSDRETILDAAGLRWAVELKDIGVPSFRQVVRRLPDGQVIPMDVIVGHRMELLQNEEFAKFLDEIVGGGQAVWDTAGSIRDGSIIFATLVPEEAPNVTIRDGDPNKLYLIGMNGHDGHHPLMVFLSLIRVVCANTLFAAEGSALAKWRRRHTINLHRDSEKAREALGIAIRKDIVEVVEQMRDLEIRKLTEEILDKWLANLWPPSGHAAVETLRSTHRQGTKELTYSGKGNRGETLFDAYNGWLEYTEHAAPTEKMFNTQERMENRFRRLIFGEVERQRRSARKSLLTLHDRILVPK